jgi:hypothetical protein
MRAKPDQITTPNFFNISLILAVSIVRYQIYGT